MQITKELSGEDEKNREMERSQVAHLAGLFDGCGSLGVQIMKDETSKIGYRFRPYLEIHLQKDDETTLGKLDAYSEERAIQYNLPEQGNVMMYRVTDPYSIEEFLDPLRMWLISTHESTQLMIEEILPSVKNGEHKTKEGFYKLVGLAEKLRELQSTNREAKYTQEYFDDEWDLQAA